MGGDGSGAYRYPKVVGYTLVKQIGGGGFSSVFQAVHYDEHRVAACKVIKLTVNTSPAERKTIDKEMRVHSNLKHPNILEFINAVVVEPSDRSGSDSGERPYLPAYYMLLEFAAAGDLFDKIAPDVGLSEDTAHFYFRQILDGVRFIHGEGVCHRDLKPENLLLDAAGKVKISDFGLSSVYKLKETGRTRMLSDRCGSLPYVAPELNSTEPYEAEPIDVWGVGVILFTMLVGNTPWDEPTKRSREFNRYVSGAYLNDDPWTRLSDQAHSLITGLLTIHPQDRFTLEYAQQHPWVLPESQLASQSPEAVAERLTQSLRDNGDLALANPDLSPSNEDEDTVMLSATRGSQFVNSLLLFSQSQYGTRYTKQLTRFYATIPPGELFIRIEEAFAELGVKSKRGPVDAKSQTARMRVGGLDNRNVAYKGWIDVEPFATLDCPSARTYCVLSRDEGDPLSWRRLFKALVAAPQVMPHLLVRNK